MISKWQLAGQAFKTWKQLDEARKRTSDAEGDERHQRLVVGTVTRMLGSNSDVEDIAQQVFLRVWKSAKRYVPRAKFTTWLLKITRNLVFNELRRRSRHAHLPLQVESENEERPIKDERATAPDASLLEQELQRAIEAAIARYAVLLENHCRKRKISTINSLNPTESLCDGNSVGLKAMLKPG
jgi:RNA polymerase sigma factor (sigma-70 family)